MASEEIITIVGAGVAGLTIAAELNDRGHSVQIIDKAEGFGHEQCSWYAGGMLAPWVERENAEQPVVDAGQVALTWWTKHIGVENVTMNGSLVLAQNRDAQDLMRFSRRTSQFKSVANDDISALEPDLTDRFQHGLFFQDEGHLSPRNAIKILYNNLLDRDVKVHFGTEIANFNEIHPKSLVIDARGLAAKDKLSDLRGVKGEMLYLKTSEITLSRPVRLLHPRIPLYIVPRHLPDEENLFMVGATMIESEERDRITARSMMELLNAAYALHPAFGEAEIVETGADVRPAFPDNLPRLRWRKEENRNVLYVNGLYRHGYLLAPAVAQMAADMIDDPRNTKNHRPQFCDEDQRA